jgi:hypothetical protein
MFDSEIDKLTKMLSIRVCRAQRELQEAYPYLQFCIAIPVNDRESSILLNVSTVIVVTSPEAPGHFIEMCLQQNAREALSELYKVKVSSGPTIVRKHVESAFDKVLIGRDIELTTDNMLNEVIESIKYRTALKEPSDSWKCIFREYARRGLEFAGDNSIERSEYVEICKKLGIPFEGMTYENKFSNRVLARFVEDSRLINREVGIK